MKTNFLKRLAALCIALIMALGMTMTVSADISADATGTISVTGAEADVRVTAYRLMDVNYDTTANQPKDPVYTWVDGIADWVRNNYQDYIGKDPDNSVQEAFNSTAVDTEIAAFYDALAAQIRSNKITLDSKPATADTAGNANITGLQMGNYLVLVENGLRVYRPSAVNLVPVWDEVDKTWEMSTPAVVDPKSEELTITKAAETSDDKDLTASIGDTVNYTVTADVPGYPANTLAQNKIFNIYDTLQTGLTLEAGSFQVTGYVGGTPTNLTEENTGDKYYTLKTDAATDLDSKVVSFSIVFKYDALKDGSGVRFDKVQVKYNAMVDADAQAFKPNTDTGNLGNTAKLSYGNNPYAENATHKNKTDEAKVYTYGVNISKVDAKNEHTFLPGAEFTISESRDGANPIKFVKDSDGVYRKAVTEDEVAATATLIVGESGDQTGKLALEGLDAGTYYLTETKAPGGYNKLGSPVEITITDIEPNGIVNDGIEAADGTEAADGADGYTDVIVKNSQGFQLPTTGGIGTVIFTACGVLLMGLGAAVIAFVLMRRRRG